MTLFLDYYGIPGCGKTRNSIEVYEELVKIGYPCLLFSEYKKTHKCQIKDLHTKSIFHDFIKQVPIYLLLPFSLPWSCTNRIYHLKVTISEYLLMIDCIRRHPNTIIISDESIIQSIVSSSYFESIKHYFLIKCIMRNMPVGYMAVNVQCDIDQAYIRIKCRNRGDNTIDRVDKTTAVNILKNQRQSFSTISEMLPELHIKSIKISTQNGMNCIEDIISVCKESMVLYSF